MAAAEWWQSSPALPSTASSPGQRRRRVIEVPEGVGAAGGEHPAPLVAAARRENRNSGGRAVTTRASGGLEVRAGARAVYMFKRSRRGKIGESDVAPNRPGAPASSRRLDARRRTTARTTPGGRATSARVDRNVTAGCVASDGMS